MPRISPTAHFIKRLKKLPPARQEKASQALVLFATEPKLPRLKFRPLQSSPGHFIIDSARGDRIILRDAGDDVYEAVDVGTHDIYRVWNR